MRGIRIWHLAALALSVPLLAAAVPSGCTGGLNPNFRNAIGQGAGTAIPVPTGYMMVGLFNETGLEGHVDITVTGKSWTKTWNTYYYMDRPTGLAWACDLTSIDILGGEVFVPDPAGGPAQAAAIDYNGGILSGNRVSDPLGCGTFLKLRVVPTTTGYEILVDVLK